MNITISLTKSYMRYAVVMLLSLAEHHKDASINVYVLHNDLSDEDFAEMDWVIGADNLNLIPVRLDKGICNVFEMNGWNEAASYRLLSIDLFAEDMDRILHIDIDTLITGSLIDLYNMDFEENYLIACEDWYSSDKAREINNKKRNLPKDARYINSGVLLFNLKKLKADGFSYELFKSIPIKYPNLVFEYPDQDLINYLFYGHIRIADAMRYNYAPSFYQDTNPDKFFNTRDKLAANTSIVHMPTGDKPWKGYHRNAATVWWWEFAKQTPYYEGLMKEHISSLLHHIDYIYTVNRDNLEERPESDVHMLEIKADALFNAIQNELETYKYLKLQMGVRTGDAEGI